MRALRTLGSFERALLVQDRYGPFHVVAVLQLDGAPAPDILRAALALLHGPNALRAPRVRQPTRRPYFQANSNHSPPPYLPPPPGGTPCPRPLWCAVSWSIRSALPRGPFPV